jgi:hypothetical protein
MQIMQHLIRPCPATFLALALVACTVNAQQVMLTPGTLVLDSKTHSGEITVGNPGDTVSTFRVEDSAFIQALDGQLSANPNPKPVFGAQDMLRVGPRRFVLASGEGQTVRVAARVPAGLAPGEYRAHLSVTNVAEQKPRVELAIAGGPNQSSIAIAIPLNVAFGVRVLLRHDVTPQGGRPSNVKVHQEGAISVVDFDVERLGMTSLLAAAEPFARAKDGHELKSWAQVSTSIYAELPSRHFVAKIPNAEIPKGATLCVRLKHEDPGAPKLADVEVCPM